MSSTLTKYTYRSLSFKMNLSNSLSHWQVQSIAKWFSTARNWQRRRLILERSECKSKELGDREVKALPTQLERHTKNWIQQMFNNFVVTQKQPVRHWKRPRKNYALKLAALKSGKYITSIQNVSCPCKKFQNPFPFIDCLLHSHTLIYVWFLNIILPNTQI